MDNIISTLTQKIDFDENTKCWNWIGNPRENGYCRSTFKGENWYVHRLSYIAFIGEIPEGMDICHKCDNRRCFNPFHLFAGTRKDNMMDAVLKGRIAKGFKNPQTKLSDIDKNTIVERARTGEKYNKIANDYHVTPQLIGKVAIKEGVHRRECK